MGSIFDRYRYSQLFLLFFGGGMEVGEVEILEVNQMIHPFEYMCSAVIIEDINKRSMELT